MLKIGWKTLTGIAAARAIEPFERLLDFWAARLGRVVAGNKRTL
jgi:hypothetical protein